MNNASMLAFASAIFCGAVGLTVVWNERRSLVHLMFVAGMVLLALDSVFSGLSWEAMTATGDAATVQQMVRWQEWKLWTSSLLPGVWLFFALSYGRGNYREFLSRWKFLLLAAFIVPLGLMLAGDQELFLKAEWTKAGLWELSLGPTGFYFFLFLLAGLVLVGINFEKTYRAAVGVMRWRIKFMILGLGVLFAARFCTSSQVLLSHTIDARLQMVDAVALFVGCLLMLRSFFRAGHFDLDVYPSHAVLQSSLTVLLAGIYLLAIGLFAKLLSAFSDGDDVIIKAFVFLVAAVLLTILLLVRPRAPAPQPVCEPAFPAPALRLSHRLAAVYRDHRLVREPGGFMPGGGEISDGHFSGAVGDHLAGG